MVDVTRLAVYGVSFFAADIGYVGDSGTTPVVGVAILAAFLGTFASSRLLKSITMSTIRRTVGAMLLALGVALASGLV